MLVKDIMTYGARTVNEDTPMMDVASLMCLYGYSGLPVVDDAGQVIGFIAEKDVLAQLFPSVEEIMEGGIAAIDFSEKVHAYDAIMGKTVAEYMTRGVLSVTSHMPILKAAVIMANKRLRRIPVVDDGKLVGMLSLGDIHKAIFHKNLTSD